MKRTVVARKSITIVDRIAISAPIMFREIREIVESVILVVMLVTSYNITLALIAYKLTGDQSDTSNLNRKVYGINREFPVYIQSF